jgi:CRP-like cAMP-binding protein
VAEGDVQVVGFNPDALAGAFERDRRTALSFYWTFWKSLSRKLRDTNRRLEEFFSRTGGSDDSSHRRGGGEAADFRVDLAAKRKLFEEQRLSRMEINFLTTLSQERRLAPGELLFREGDDGEEMYVVLEGRVMIYKFIPGAGEEALAFLERGDYFGEMALIDREPRSAWARADERGAVVLAIPEDVIGGILDISKVSSLPLLKILCSLVAKRLRELDEKLIGWYILSGGNSSEGLPPKTETPKEPAVGAAVTLGPRTGSSPPSTRWGDPPGPGRSPSAPPDPPPARRPPLRPPRPSAAPPGGPAARKPGW